MRFLTIEYGHYISKTPFLCGSDDLLLIHQMRHPSRNDTVTVSVLSFALQIFVHFGNVGIPHAFFTKHVLCAINKVLVELHEPVSTYT